MADVIKLRGRVAWITALADDDDAARDQVILGSALRALRERAGLTQEQFGERAGMDATYLSQFENGHRGIRSSRVELFDRREVVCQHTSTGSKSYQRCPFEHGGVCNGVAVARRQCGVGRKQNLVVAGGAPVFARRGNQAKVLENAQQGGRLGAQ